MLRVARPRRIAWDGDRAWPVAATGVVLGFIAITWWWLSRDLGVPFADAGSHLFTVVGYHDRIEEGDMSVWFQRSGYYPPYTYALGALAVFIGGVNATAPVLGQNLFYVPLLSLGVYQTGKRVAGKQAGFLAVVFVVGTPLLIEQFHVFMLDAPQAALVSVAIWLVLASEQFTKLPTSAAAGVACGLGIGSKEQFPLFLVGLVAVVLAHRGVWRNWKGIGVFALAAVVIGSPWYVANLSELGHYASAGLANANLPPRGRPALLSISNLGWYFWALLNGVLFAPLFLFAAIGVGTAGCAAIRRSRNARLRSQADVRPALLAGLFVGWLGLSLTPHHDMRYAMSLVPYLAVLGTAWVVRLPAVGRRLAIAALVLAATATTLGISFGAGPDVRLVLGAERVVTNVSFGIPAPNEITFHSDHNFNVAAPRDEDDVPALFKAMKRDGVTGVAWNFGDSPVGDPVFDVQGVALFARFAGLMTSEMEQQLVHAGPVAIPAERGNQRWLLTQWNVDDPNHVFLMRRGVYGREAPCMRLRDGTGLWLRRGAGDYPEAPPYCPLETG